MIPATIIGKKYEAIACNYLTNLRYKIIEKNYKNFIGEIDIICRDEKCIVFVEVKYRTSAKFGRPIEAITPYKVNKIRQVATGYLKYKRMLNNEIRFDAVEILDNEIRHLKNCF